MPDLTTIVRTAYENVGPATLEASIRRTLHPECRWFPSSEFPEQEVFVGHDGARRFIERFQTTFKNFWMRPEQFLVVADRFVIVPLRIGGTLRSSDVEVSKFYVHVWEFDGGLAICVRTFLDLQTAHAAVSAETGPEGVIR